MPVPLGGGVATGVGTGTGVGGGGVVIGAATGVGAGTGGGGVGGGGDETGGLLRPGKMQFDNTRVGHAPDTKCQNHSDTCQWKVYVPQS
jgi:hypothetical protein